MSASTEKKNRIASREAGNDKKALAMQEEAAKKAKEKLKWIVVGSITAVIIIAILVLNFVCPKVCDAVKIGGEGFTAAEVNYNYANQYYNFANQYGQYASMFGLDTQNGLSGLRSQACGMMEDGTWRDYFIEDAMGAMAQQKALKDYADENGVVLSEEDLAEIDEEYASLDVIAKGNGFTSTEKFLNAYYGAGVNEEIAKEQARSLSLASKAFRHYQDSLQYTPEELKAEYESYNGEKDYFDVCYYYIAAETVADEEGNSAPTDETRAAAKEKAEAVLAEYNSEELAEVTDVEKRLNEAIARTGAEDTCVHSERSSGSGISYKDWALTASEGDATVAENTNGDGYYVAAFISHDDNSYKLAQVRHILVKAEADEEGNYTDEAKAAAKAKAEEIYDKWKSGEATEESFAELAEQFSEDAGSNTNGGLYDNVQKGQMVEEFDAFCFAGHKPGDTGIVYGEAAGSYAGYHVIYYVGEGEVCKDYIAKNSLINTALEEFNEELIGKYEPEKTFWIRYVG